MQRALRWIVGALLFTLAATCARGEPGAPGSMQNEEDIVAITLLHLNDVYELTPVSGGTEGGLARVATLRKQLREQNPNTYTILAGDLLNPSALSTAMVDDKRLAGRQMVDVMNVMGLDYATFGNHEFDLKQEELTQRLSESKFTWFSSNVADANRQPLPKIPPNVVFTAKNEAGKQARIGLFGLTVVNSNPATYVTYRDPVEVAKEQVAALRDKVDVLIAVTHLNLEGDIQLVQRVPEIDLVVGGHEHENAQVWRGPDFTPILKADANARAVYVHQLRYDTTKKKLQTEATLQRVTADIADDPAVAKAVDRWVKVAFAGFKAQGFDPEHAVTEIAEPLDGREASVRNFPTRLTRLVATGMVHAAPGTELAIFNSGSIRIDDVLPPGEVTEYDIIRTLPFGGIVLSAEMKGGLLQKVLDQGKVNAGTGGYLQTANVTWSAAGNQWLINGVGLDPAKSYQVAINDFLVSGRENTLDFLTRDNPAVSKIAEHGDIRKALIGELQKTYGAR